MARVKNSFVTRKRRKKIIKQAKGYFGTKSTHFKKAKEQVMKSLAYAYRDRKQRKRDFRRLWIQRINAAVRPHNMSYSKFIYGLRLANIELNRKILSELAINNPNEFNNIVKIAKKHIDKK